MGIQVHESGMPIMLGSRDRIVGRIGAGGMGEVYRPLDVVLDRHVALRGLPPEVATDPERLARFQREGQTIPLAGGAPSTICAAARSSGASWGVDGTIVLAPASDARLWRVSAGAGTPGALTQLSVVINWPRGTESATAAVLSGSAS